MSAYLTIESGKYNVLALGELDDNFNVNFPALSFLQHYAETAQYGGSARGFKKLFQRYADGGRNKLTNDLFHEVDRPNGIWEFIKGDLRIFCFVEKNNVVITNGGVKHSQKADQGDVGVAIRSKAGFRLNI